MHSRKRLLSLCGLVTILVVLVLGLRANGLIHVQAAPAKSHASPAKYIPLCGPVDPGFARCFAMREIKGATPLSGGGPPGSTCAPNPANGYAPCDLQAAYNLPSNTAGFGQTVAVVDAYDNPNAEFDMGIYRTHFGLPSCTTANGCFRKVNQNGVQGKYPKTPPKTLFGWTVEIALDLDMVSAVCPNCHILLVEANSQKFTDLTAAVDQAAALGANVISNSYGGICIKNKCTPENGIEANNDSYNHPGIAIVASSGDNGYGAQYPAASPFVTAVGGTELFPNNTTARGWAEVAWYFSGDGCSVYEPQPLWQQSLINVTTVCSNRAIADVSAVADGVAMFDSFAGPNKTWADWTRQAGTSVSAPIIAGVYALAGNESNITYGSYPYNHTSSLNDVTTGSINCAGGGAFCDARPGWDGPTGLGTPNGTGGF